MQISLSAEADILLSVGSGYWIHKTKRGTAPTSTTFIASSGVCLAIQERAHAAASFTLGSNSSKQTTSAYKALESTTALASCAECLATALRTKAAAFL